MPITKSTKPTWFDSKGVMHTTIEEAQAAEMYEVLCVTDGSHGMEEKVLRMLATDLVRSQRDALLAILTTGPTSRPGARKRAGTTSPRRAARATRQTATPAEQAALSAKAAEAFKEMHAAVEAA